jgi:hypothetical protein
MMEEELQKLSQTAAEIERDHLLYAEHLWQEGYLRGLIYALAVCGTTRPLPEWAADGLTVVLHELDIGKDGIKFELDSGRERIKYGGQALREKHRKHEERWSLVTEALKCLRSLSKEEFKQFKQRYNYEDKDIWAVAYAEASKILFHRKRGVGADAVEKSYKRVQRAQKKFLRMRNAQAGVKNRPI